MKKQSSKLYNTFRKMKERCNNPNSDKYKYYGGKGIKVCEEWSSFSNFKEWALNSGYVDGLTIDRKDNSKNYCPKNCRWATIKQQANNKTTNVFIEINGISKTVSQWSEIFKMDPDTIYNRIKKGVCAEKIFLPPTTTENKVHNNHYVSIGKQMNALGLQDEKQIACYVLDGKIIIQKGDSSMSKKKCNSWGGSRSIRLETECRELGINVGDTVYVRVEENKIIIEKLETEYHVVNGSRFVVKE